jgi:predicted anti-sigma-YlaC factor YlaD
MSEETKMSECEAVVRALWDFLDAELDDASLAEIDEHLSACEPCRAHALFEQQLLDELSCLRREHTDIDALRARIEAALERVKVEG